MADKTDTTNFIIPEGCLNGDLKIMGISISELDKNVIWKKEKLKNFSKIKKGILNESRRDDS